MLSNPIALVVVSVASIAAAFALAITNIEFETKVKVFAFIIVAYLVYCGISFVTRDESSGWFHTSDPTSPEEIEQKLLSLEEAATYFGGSLKPVDMFRLMASRVKDIVHFDTVVLFTVDHVQQKLRVVHADGENADLMRSVEFGLNVGLAGSAYSSKDPQVARGHITTNETFFLESVNAFKSAAAIPLARDGDVFAVVQFFSRSRSAFDGNASSYLEAISERVSPMVLASLSLEQSVSNALTDPVTNLPNERAFYMILENQLAETQRNRDARPLSVLAIDIKYFNDVNERFGHAAGNGLLNFVAQKLKDQLRQMDFFSRASNDEFLVILPTANTAIVNEIVGRITTEFVNCKYSVTDIEGLTIDLNFGSSSFGVDGETAGAILAAARERKEQSKSVIPSKVVWFPREYIN